jgi:hypothetical protein
MVAVPPAPHVQSDVQGWRRQQLSHDIRHPAESVKATGTVSVVIPALNEQHNIRMGARADAADDRRGRPR